MIITLVEHDHWRAGSDQQIGLIVHDLRSRAVEQRDRRRLVSVFVFEPKSRMSGWIAGDFRRRVRYRHAVASQVFVSARQRDGASWMALGVRGGGGQARVERGAEVRHVW
jgi:hypothetical protein